MSARSYDWASAVLNLMTCEPITFLELVSAAGLDPFKGDLINCDFDGLNLEGQDMSGWDLRYATFKKANIAQTNFENAQLNLQALVEANNWDKAILDKEAIELAAFYAKLKKPIESLKLNKRYKTFLKKAKIPTIGDLICLTENELKKSLYGPVTEHFLWLSNQILFESAKDNNKLQKTQSPNHEEALKSSERNMSKLLNAQKILKNYYFIDNNEVKIGRKSQKTSVSNIVEDEPGLDQEILNRWVEANVENLTLMMILEVQEALRRHKLYLTPVMSAIVTDLEQE